MRLTFTVLAIILSYSWYVAPRAPRGAAAVPIVLIAALTIRCAARTGDWGLDWRALLPGLRAIAIVTVPAGLAILLAGAALGTLHDRRDFLGTFGGLFVWAAAQQWVLQTLVLREARRVSRQLTDALASRDVIAQATGVLLARGAADAREAFTSLAGAARRAHRPVEEVARALLAEVTDHPTSGTVP